MHFLLSIKIRIQILIFFFTDIEFSIESRHHKIMLSILFQSQF